MRFSLSPDLIALRDAARALLAAQCPPGVVRAAWSGSTDATEAVWQHLAEMGLFAAQLAEEKGGLGLVESDLVPVLIEIGYAAVPHPVAETMAVAVPLLAASDPADQLGVVAAGGARVAIAGPTGLVPYGSRADLVLVLTGTEARLVRPGAGPAVSTVDGSRGITRPDLPTGTVVTVDPELLRLTADRADLATAAQLVGLGRRMLELTTAYVAARRQFGVPVGSFQAVKHRLADALLRLEFAEPAVLAAGWSLAATSPDASRDVSVAVVLATEAAQEVAAAAIQCHGAIGYTVEYDLHLYAKRAWALAAGCRVDEHLDRLAEVLELKGVTA